MIIAKYQKPFSDGEFVKECFLESGATLYSDYSNKNSIMKQIENLQLSHQTIQRRIIALSNDIQLQSKQFLNNCISFSLCFDFKIIIVIL